jgi:hypothetical protein
LYLYAKRGEVILLTQNYESIDSFWLSNSRVAKLRRIEKEYYICIFKNYVSLDNEKFSDIEELVVFEDFDESLDYFCRLTCPEDMKEVPQFCYQFMKEHKLYCNSIGMPSV